MEITYPLTVYYDASCPMCRSEMETLKDNDSENKLILVDCSDNNFSTPTSCPVDKETMMERIHAIDANGYWIESADVFAAVYNASGFTKLAKFWGNKTLQPILNTLYPYIAFHRRWLSKTPLPYVFNWLLKIITKK